MTRHQTLAQWLSEKEMTKAVLAKKIKMTRQGLNQATKRHSPTFVEKFNKIYSEQYIMYYDILNSEYAIMEYKTQDALFEEIKHHNEPITTGIMYRKFAEKYSPVCQETGRKINAGEKFVLFQGEFFSISSEKYEKEASTAAQHIW